MRDRACRALWTLVCSAFVLAAVTAVPAVARPERHHRHPPRIELSRHVVLVDHSVRISVRGVAPHGLVRLHLTLERGDATTWTSQAVFRADRYGRVRVATTAPVVGDYRGVDPMGLFWSAQLTHQVPNPVPPPYTDIAHLTVEAGRRTVASTDLIRFYKDPGVRETPVRAHGLVGTLFEPPGRHRHRHRHRHRPALLVLGGSEGGIPAIQAALFASHGYEVLALTYFDPTGSLGGGLPRELSLIPLEYLATGIDWLSHRPGVDPARIGIAGASKGAEAALLVASRQPRVKAVVAIAPSSVVWPGISNTSDSTALFDSSWSEAGRPVTFLPYHVPFVQFDLFRLALDDVAAAQRAAIPVERINGPVLLISGNDDKLWPSGYMACERSVNLAIGDH